MDLSTHRRLPTAAVVLFGALLAGTAFYLVPTLVLNGLLVPAVVAALLWVGGAGALWVILGRADARLREGLALDRAGHELYRSLVENGSEAHLILDTDGDVLFASANVEALFGEVPRRLEANGGVLDRVSPADRWHVLRAWAGVLRTPGAAHSLEGAARLGDDRVVMLQVRLCNLLHEETVGGILCTLRDATPRAPMEADLQHLAYYDPLTGLASRRFFFEQGANALSLARRHRSRAAVLSVELEHFAAIQARFGHERADALLEEAAEGVRASVRDTDIAARVGAAAFGVVLTEVRDESAAGRVAHRILERIPTALSHGESSSPVGGRIGVAMFPGDAEGLEALLEAAHVASQGAADDLGVQFHRSGLRPALREQIQLERDLRNGLEQHEFQLHYQPVFQLATGQMVGAEALSRWRHFARGMVSAAEFIELAERTGLVRSLDRWAIARALHQRRASPEGRWRGWVAVNLSPFSLTDPDLPRYLRDVVSEARLEPGALILELPEEAVLRDPAAAADLMWEIKDAGAAVALDDFGMAAASPGTLRRLPVDILKLHREFVAGIGGDDGDEHLIEATISVAHAIHAKVLAKGVERDRQIDWLRDAGCDFVQGYLMGAPVPAEQLGEDRLQISGGGFEGPRG